MIVIRIDDGASIPFDSMNADYLAYLAWTRDGNTPQPPDQVVVDEKSSALSYLINSDSDMARIIEDLINVLLNKGLISTSELPSRAVSKLNDRANLRKLL